MRSTLCPRNRKPKTAFDSKTQENTSQQKHKKRAHSLFWDIRGIASLFIISALLHSTTKPIRRIIRETPHIKKTELVFLAESSIFSRSHIRIRKQLCARGTGGRPGKAFAEGCDLFFTPLTS